MLLWSVTKLGKFNIEFPNYKIFMRQIPDSRCGSAPRSSRADSHIVLLVDILQKFDIDSLVSLLGISKIAKILSQKRVRKYVRI